MQTGGGARAAGMGVPAARDDRATLRHLVEIAEIVIDRPHVLMRRRVMGVHAEIAVALDRPTVRRQIHIEDAFLSRCLLSLCDETAGDRRARLVAVAAALLPFARENYLQAEETWLADRREGG